MSLRRGHWASNQVTFRLRGGVHRWRDEKRLKHSSTHILGVIQRRNGDWLDVVHEQRVKVLQAGPGVVHLVLHKDADRPQHEGDEEVHMDVVPGAVETPSDGGGVRERV